MLIWGGKTPAQCWNSVDSSQTHLSVTGTKAKLELHELFLGLTLLNSVKMVNGFSTPGKGRSCFVFLQGNVPSEPGTTLFFEKHLQRCLSPTEGTPKLAIREPTTFSCSWITLGMAWGRLERTGSPCPHKARSLCHLQVLRMSLAQAGHERSFQEEWLC